MKKKDKYYHYIVLYLGMTLDMVIVHICQKEYAAGLFYTGCSRVRDKEKLAIMGYTHTDVQLPFDEFPKIQRYTLLLLLSLLLLLLLIYRFKNMGKKDTKKKKNGEVQKSPRDYELERKDALFEKNRKKLLGDRSDVRITEEN